MKLRPATLHDIPLLQHWDHQPHIVASNPNDTWDWHSDLSTAPQWRQQWIAELEGQPLGFLQVMDPAEDTNGYWQAFQEPVPIGWRAVDIWIGEADKLGQGYGTQLMELALTHCFQDPAVRLVLVDPLADNTRAQRFYQRFGFKPLGRCQFGADWCLVLGLRRADWLQPSDE